MVWKDIQRAGSPETAVARAASGWVAPVLIIVDPAVDPANVAYMLREGSVKSAGRCRSPTAGDCQR